MKKIGILLFLAGILCTTIAIVVWYFHDDPLLSPLVPDAPFQFIETPATSAPTPKDKSQRKIIYGFLPYWNVNTVQLQPELTNLAYFGLSFDGSGRIIDQQGGTVDQGFHTLGNDTTLKILNTASQNHTNTEIVVGQFDADQIAQFLLNPAAQQKLTNSLDAVLSGYPFSGVNIDIEYLGDVTPNLRADYVTFIRNLSAHLHQKFPQVKLSIDVMVTAASANQIWDLPALSPFVDHVVVMAYDYHQKSSILSGPVAPLLSTNDGWSTSITQHLKDFLTVVPKNKILLGVPFYGYEWQTESRAPQSPTYQDTGSTASIKHIQDILSQKKELDVQENWDNDALSPYLSYKKDGHIYMIYYENSRSISYKLDLINQLDLGGVAIWALGYENNSRELWDVIKNKL